MLALTWVVATSCADASRGAIVREAGVDRNLGEALALVWARCASFGVGLRGAEKEARTWLIRGQRREPIVLGAGGRGRVRGIAPGRWRLLVQRGEARRERSVMLRCGHNVFGEVVVPRPSALWGRVVGKKGKPIAGARIEARDPGGGESISAQSAADGSFVLEGIVAGPHLLATTAPGWRALERTVEVPQEVVLRLLPARRVEGYLREARGVVTEVTLVGPALRRRAYVAPSGHFEFEELLPGSYEIFAASVKAPWQASALIVARAGQGPVEISLQPAIRLRGRVVGEDGRPLLSRVVLRPSRPVIFSVEVETDAEGNFIAPALPAGRYRVEVWAAGWLPSLGTMVDLSRGREPLRVRLERGKRLSGRVLDQTGKPVTGALVRVFPGSAALGPRIGELGVVPGRVPPIPAVGVALPRMTAMARLWSAMTDAEGLFTVEGLPAGKASYSVEHPAYQVAQGRADLRRASVLEIRLGRASRASGVVLNSRGLVVPSARVVARSGEAIRRVQTDGRGSFQIVGLALPMTLWAERGDDRSEVKRIEEGTDMGALELVLKTLERVHGVVRAWRTAAPILRFSVAVDDKKAREFRLSAGRFSLTLEPGARRLLVRAPGYVRKELVVEVLDPRRSGRREALLFELKAAGSIEGTIRDASGQPVAGAEVRASGLSARSDKEGRFTIEEVPEGSHVVTVRVGSTSQRSDPISVRAGERSGPLRFHLAISAGE